MDGAEVPSAQSFVAMADSVNTRPENSIHTSSNPHTSSPIVVNVNPGGTDSLVGQLLASRQDPQFSQQDMRNFFQEEMKTALNKEQDDFLKGLMQILEEKKKADQQEEEEKILMSKVNELTKKLEEMEHEKKVAGNREWMMRLLDKMTDNRGGSAAMADSVNTGPESNIHTSSNPHTSNSIVVNVNSGSTDVLLAQLLASRQDPQISERDMRNIFQEEMKTALNKEQGEVLKALMQITEEKDKANQQEEEEKMLLSKVEELTKKLEKVEHDNRVSGNREWMMRLVDRMTSNCGGYHYRTQPDRYRPRWINNNPSNSCDRLPWSDGPKSMVATYQTPQPAKVYNCPSMVQSHVPSFNTRGRGHHMVQSHVPSFNTRGRGHHYDGQKHHFKPANQGRGTGKQIHSTSSGNKHPGQGKESSHQHHNHQNSSHGDKNTVHTSKPAYQGRGSSQQHHNQNSTRGGKSPGQQSHHSGQGRGAVPRNAAGRGSTSGSGNTQELKQLNAKLHNLANRDIKVSLSPKDLVNLTSAVKQMNVSQRKNTGNSTRGTNKPSGPKKPTTGGAKK